MYTCNSFSVGNEPGRVPRHDSRELENVLCAKADGHRDRGEDNVKIQKKKNETKRNT